MTFQAQCKCGERFTFQGRTSDERPPCPKCGAAHKTNRHLDSRIEKLNRNTETAAFAGMEQGK